jgi:predicted Rossmann fold nucleotide-binding protein DprA/Smf involved in DNA uptake
MRKNAVPPFIFFQGGVRMARLVGVIGSRALPASFAPLVSSVVSAFLARGFRVASGGALGADSFALSALLQQGAASRGVVVFLCGGGASLPPDLINKVHSFDICH